MNKKYIIMLAIISLFLYGCGGGDAATEETPTDEITETVEGETDGEETGDEETGGEDTSSEDPTDVTEDTTETDEPTEDVTDGEDVTDVEDDSTEMTDDELNAELQSLIDDFTRGDIEIPTEIPETYAIYDITVPAFNTLETFPTEYYWLAYSHDNNNSINITYSSIENNIELLNEYIEIMKAEGFTPLVFSDEIPDSDVFSDIFVTLETVPSDTTTSLFLAKNNESLNGSYVLEILANNIIIDINPKFEEGALFVAESETASSGREPVDALSVDDTIDIIRSFTPSELGLTGESMEDFEILFEDGIALIEGSTAARINVYEKGTSNIVGSYLVALDNSAVYKIENDTNGVTVIR